MLEEKETIVVINSKTEMRFQRVQTSVLKLTQLKDVFLSEALHLKSQSDGL